MIDTSWVIQMVQAGAVCNMAQTAQEAQQTAAEQAKQKKIAEAKASDEGILYSPFGQEKVLSIDLDKDTQDVLFYTVNGIYRISAEGDFNNKKFFILRYYNSFDDKLNCHVIHLDKELQQLFPQGWSVEGQLLNGQQISFSSTNIDKILNTKYIQEQIKFLEQSVARDEAIIQNRTETLIAEAQDKADLLPTSLVGLSVLLAVPLLCFFVLAFELNHVWWTWFCFSISCVLCAICGIFAKLLYKRPRVKEVPQEKLDQDNILIQTKKELQAHKAELIEYQKGIINE